MSKLTDRAQKARETIEKAGVPSYHGESGANGVFFPASDTERIYARYWTDEHYTWEQAINDITDDDILDGAASAITTKAHDDLIDAAKAFNDDDVTSKAVAAIRSRLIEGDDYCRQKACDAVTFVEIDEDVLAYLTDEITVDDLSGEDVDDLERIAKMA